MGAERDAQDSERMLRLEPCPCGHSPWVGARHFHGGDAVDLAIDAERPVKGWQVWMVRGEQADAEHLGLGLRRKALDGQTAATRR